MKRKKLDRGQIVRELAREKIGRVPSARPIEPKTRRNKPKHKAPAGLLPREEN